MTSLEKDRVILAAWAYGERPRDAIALAGVLARDLGMGVRIAHVCPAYGTHPPYADLSDAAEEVGWRILDDVPLELLHGVHVEKQLQAAASPAEGLHRLAEAPDVAMLVLGSTHRGALGRVLPGTVASHVLQGTACAVAVAPVGYAAERAARIGTVGVAYDGSPESHAAVDEAVAIASETGARLHVVSVVAPITLAWVGPATYPPADVTDATRRHRRAELDELLAGLPPELSAEGRLREGRPAAEIVLESEAADLFVMGSRGYGAMRRVVLGSVAGEVMRTAHCPVLVVPRAALDEHEDQLAGAAHAAATR